MSSKTKFTADDALSAIQELRGLKSDAFSQGNTKLGDAYKKASDAVENLIQRNLEARATNTDNLTAARQASAALNKFKTARTMMAKAYEVERAMNPATGVVNAQALARSPNAGSFTGELAKIRDAALALPRVTGPVKGSGPVSQLEGAASVMGAVGSHNPAWMGVPILRDLARSAMMSPTGQKLLAQPNTNPVATPLLSPDAFNPALSGISSLFQNDRSTGE